MSALKWDQTGEKRYETGTSKGVVYPLQSDNTYSKGYAWNGLSAVKESPSGAEATAFYANDNKYLTLLSAEDLSGTIEAYTFPDEFRECDGTREIAPGVYMGMQDRTTFGLCYQTIIGNDTKKNEYARKIHLIYGALASPSEKDNKTINESPEAMTLSWEFSTTPVSCSIVVDGKALKPTAIITIETDKVDETKLAALEKILYGSDPTTEGGADGTEPRLPLPDEVYTLLASEG